MQNTVVPSASKKNIRHAEFSSAMYHARTHDLRVVITTLLLNDLTGQLKSAFTSIIVYLFRVSFQEILTFDAEYSRAFSF